MAKKKITAIKASKTIDVDQFEESASIIKSQSDQLNANNALILEKIKENIFVKKLLDINIGQLY